MVNMSYLQCLKYWFILKLVFKDREGKHSSSPVSMPRYKTGSWLKAVLRFPGRWPFFLVVDLISRASSLEDGRSGNGTMEPFSFCS